MCVLKQGAILCCTPWSDFASFPKLSFPLNGEKMFYLKLSPLQISLVTIHPSTHLPVFIIFVLLLLLFVVSEAQAALKNLYFPASAPSVLGLQIGTTKPIFFHLLHSGE